jgi:hypothetical protein
MFYLQAFLPLPQLKIKEFVNMIKLEFIEKNTKPVLSVAESEEVSALLESKFSSHLNQEVFLFETSFLNHQTQVKCTLIKQDASIAYPVEAIVFLREADSTSPLPVKEQVFAALDLLDSYWTEYFQQDRSVYLGLDWEQHEYGSYTICLRGFVRNLEVEKMTEEFLTAVGHGEHAIEPISAMR